MSIFKRLARVYVCYCIALIFTKASKLRFEGELWWGGLTQYFMIHQRRHIVIVSNMLWIACINSVTLLLFQVWFESNVSVASCCFKSVSNQVHQWRHIVVVSRLIWVECISSVIFYCFRLGVSGRKSTMVNNNTRGDSKIWICSSSPESSQNLIVRSQQIQILQQSAPEHIEDNCWNGAVVYFLQPSSSE